MAHYAIGDLQGCYTELTKLLQLIDFNHGKDTIWLVGDVVNRGRDSLACLQFCMQHESSVQLVLGNHDLHLLALCYGFGKHKQKDTLMPIVHHARMTQMRDWLRQQPLLRQTASHVLVHAGLLPEWSVAQAADLAGEVQAALRDAPRDFFQNMYGNQPDIWSDTETGWARLRAITNVMTRMRVLHENGALDHDFKGEYRDIPVGRVAWFDAANRAHLSHKIVFGHWSALGLVMEKQVLALDTGALWGGHLTAVDLHTEEVFQVPSAREVAWACA